MMKELHAHYVTFACSFEGATRYGIAYISDDESRSILTSIVDVTTDETLAQRLTEQLNRMHISPEHLEDVVNDFLVEPDIVLVDWHAQ